MAAEVRRRFLDAIARRARVALLPPDFGRVARILGNGIFHVVVEGLAQHQQIEFATADAGHHIRCQRCVPILDVGQGRAGDWHLAWQTQLQQARD